MSYFTYVMLVSIIGILIWACVEYMLIYNRLSLADARMMEAVKKDPDRRRNVRFQNKSFFKIAPVVPFYMLNRIGINV